MDFYFPILLDLQLAVCLNDDIGSICQSSSCNISTWAVTAWLTSYIVSKQETNTIQGQEESVNNILSRIGITCTNIHWNNWHIKLNTRITTSLSLCLVLLMLTLLSGRLSLYFNTKQCNFIYATYTLFTSQNAMELKQTYSIFCNNSNPSNKK